MSDDDDMEYDIEGYDYDWENEDDAEDVVEKNDDDEDPEDRDDYDDDTREEDDGDED